MRTRNLIQTELFFVGSARSLDVLLGQIQERLEGGARIKTTVRFYDRWGALTRLGQRMARIKKKEQLLWDKFLSSEGWRRTYYNWRMRTLAAQSIALRDETGKRAATVMRNNIRYGQPLAIERPDRTFRHARRDEIHELLEASNRAVGTWVFVFKPNHILSNSNTLVASVM